MNRRSSIKSIVLGSVAGGFALKGCSPASEEQLPEKISAPTTAAYGRTPEEKLRDLELHAEQFFSPEELNTLDHLCDLILPPDGEHVGASAAGVPDFIEFMAKDYPDFQLPLRGGLMWLDHECNLEFGQAFVLLDENSQKQILDKIAYPDPEVPHEEQPLGVQFFSLLRNLTLTGYYTSKEGIQALGYKGNSPNIWDGVPEEVLAAHGVAYEESWLAKCVDQSKRNTIAQWDEKGNLLT